MPAIHWELPPLSNLYEMFEYMVEKAIPIGFGDAVKLFRDRPIRLATMCSGTESPIVALSFICDALKRRGFSLAYEHMFSAEVVPFKQAFIQRNFMPPILFRDVMQIEMGREAETAFAAKMTPPPPGHVQLLVAGFACVDFSALNTKKRPYSFDLNRNGRSAGESSATFEAVYRYAQQHRPAIIILENIVGAGWDLLVERFSKIDYVASYLILDSKNYCLPQTRQRGYMVCVNTEKESAMVSKSDAEEGVSRWREIIQTLARKASSPVECFLSADSDSTLQQWLNNTTHSAKDTKSKNVSNWEICRERHRSYRQECGTGPGHPYSQLDKGKLAFPPYANKQWLAKQTERVIETLDIIKLANAVKDYDIEYHAKTFDVSQNVDRKLDSVAPGLTGCITPSGCVFSALRGRPISGIEALALQGLPVDRLHITTESQKDLQDLAGNAMTSTVIGAALISAFAAIPNAISFHSASEYIESISQASLTFRSLATSNQAITGASLQSRCHFGPLRTASAKEVMALAGRTRQWCPCEGQNGVALQVLKCQDCLSTVCKSCSGNPLHNLELVRFELARLDPQNFLDAMFNILPTRLVIAIDVKMFVEAAVVSSRNTNLVLNEAFETALQEGLGQEVRLRRVRRGPSWTIGYSSSRLHVLLEITELKIEWLLFVIPAKQLPGNDPLRTVLGYPIARQRVHSSAINLLEGSWEICLPQSKLIPVSVTGSEPIASWRNELGVPKYSNEKVWKYLQIEGTLRYDADERLDISGDYVCLPRCGTANRALHKLVSKRAHEPSEALFLFFNPDPYDATKDSMVISPVPMRKMPGEYREIFGRLHKDKSLCDEVEEQQGYVLPTADPAWKPSQVKRDDIHYLVFGEWQPCRAAIFVPSAYQGIEEIAMFGNPIHDSRQLESHCSMSGIDFLSCKFRWTDQNPIGTETSGFWTITEANENHMSVDIWWLMSRIPLFGAHNSSTWAQYKVTPREKFCIVCAPPAPEIRWKLVERAGKARGTAVTMAPFEDASQAGPFERAWKARPAPLVTEIRVQKQQEFVDCWGSVRISINPSTLVHRAIARFPHRTSSDHLRAFWRLCLQYNPHEKPKLPKFDVQSNQNDKPLLFAFEHTNDQEGSRLALNLQQAKSMRWMLLRDGKTAPKVAEELIEEACSGILRWKLEAKVSRVRQIRGGILADQVGYGKTILILALIRATIHSATGEAQVASEVTGGKAYPIPTRATCIFVPQTLIPQWQEEIRRFWPACKLITICSGAHLAKITISDMKDADIVLTTPALLHRPHYIERLAHLSALPKPPSIQRLREMRDWHITAEERLRLHVLKLLRNGPKGFASYLRMRYQEYDGDWTAYDLQSSKRLRGNAFQQQQKQNNEISSGKEGKSSLTIIPATAKQDKYVDIYAKTIEEFPEPVFGMFRFHRKVVDEQTFVSSLEMLGISSIPACSSWVLSATPRLDDFVDIQRLASFLGFHLGDIDCTAGITTAQNIKDIQQDWTDAERFQSRQNLHSAAWHNMRKKQAQQFLNTFARRNFVEIADIEMVEHFVPVRLDACHRIINAETQALILCRGTVMGTYEPQVGTSCDRTHRLWDFNRALSIHESLLQIATFDRYEQHDKIDKGSRSRLEIRHAHRMEKEKAAETAFYSHLLALKRYQTFVNAQEMEKLSGVCLRSPNDVYGDPEISEGVRQLFATTHEIDEDAVRLSLLRDHGMTDADLSGPQWQRFLRKGIAEVHQMARVLVDSKRATRFFENARYLQKASVKFKTGTAIQADCGCVISNCSEVQINVLCGHMICSGCLSDPQMCSVSGCNATMTDRGMVTLDQLANDQAPESRFQGRKIDSMVDIIQSLGEDDQILIFSQYDSVTAAITHALKSLGIPFSSVREIGATEAQVIRAQKAIHAFRTRATASNSACVTKVLILDPADAAAAGHNLTNVSVAIFIAPLISSDRQAFEAAYTQSVGRMRRLGQTKIVQVYHLVTLHTLEVDILEHQYNRKLALVKVYGKENLEMTDVHAHEAEEKGVEDLGSKAYRLAGLEFDE